MNTSKHQLMGGIGSYSKTSSSPSSNLADWDSPNGAEDIGALGMGVGSISAGWKKRSSMSGGCDDSLRGMGGAKRGCEGAGQGSFVDFPFPLSSFRRVRFGERMGVEVVKEFWNPGRAEGPARLWRAGDFCLLGDMF